MLVMAIMALAGCSEPPDIMGIDNPAIPAASVPDVSRHRLFIVTTRGLSDEPGAFLSAERSPNLRVAAVDVTVPPTHVTGELERPKRLPPDPRTEFTVTNPVIYDSDAQFIAEINRELATRALGDRKLLLFVHGYNNSVSDASLRLAQFVEDTGFKGVPILLAWASADKTSRYVYDLNSALIARGKVKEVADIMVRTNAGSADVFAHSMGNLLTVEGMLDLQQAGVLGRRGNINHIMLAAPDIDLDLFRTQIVQLAPAIREKIFILVSKDDGALRVSSRIAGGVPRVGAANAEELEKLGVTVIDLSEIDDSSSGSHTKFAGSPEVVKLIGAGLNSVSQFGHDDTPAIQQILAVSPIRILSE
jgi:esterase/lipase superfamily enzyme